MSDNAQTTDPLAEVNRAMQYDDYPDRGVPEADVAFPPLVRDPDKYDGPPPGTPVWKGAQASDFD